MHVFAVNRTVARISPLLHVCAGVALFAGRAVHFAHPHIASTASEEIPVHDPNSKCAIFAPNF
jgi:hypothetical protein